MSKKARVLDYLRGGYSITPLEAFNMFKSMRLGAIIHELKQEGWNIKTDIVSNGESHFAKYTLITQVDSKGQFTLV